MIVLLLKWRPALADQVDSSGSTPLHFASSDGDHRTVRAILEHAPSSTGYGKDSDGLSALHVAAQMGHGNVVKELLERCPDAAEIRDNNGGTFLHAAAKERRLKVVSVAISKKPTILRRLLMKAQDKEVVPMLPRRLLNAQDKEGNTPLHLAVAAGATDVVEALLRKGEARPDVLNNAGQTPFDLAKNSDSYFTMASLVVTLIAFNAQPGPQRQDKLEKWDTQQVAKVIEKTSDSLTVVAVLIATAAFAAGFNLPGGYGDDSHANLILYPTAFRCFVFLDSLAVAASVVAAILLVHGKASCSSGSSKSFASALHCIWLSLISLMMAFYVALVAVSNSSGESCQDALSALHVCVQALIWWIMTWLAPATKYSITSWRFLWRCCGSKGRQIIKRQYSLAGAYIPNLFVFATINFMASIGFIVLSYLSPPKHSGTTSTGQA